MLLKHWAILAIMICKTAFTVAQIPKHLFNEISGEEYSSKNFANKLINVKQKAGVYHFGESEAEWDFVVLNNGDSLIVQIWKGAWGTNYFTKNAGWIKQCKTFNQVRVEENKIFFGNFSGLFADYKKDNKTSKSLLLFCDLINERNYGKDSAEVGFKNAELSIEGFFSIDSSHKYNKLSTTVLPENYFKEINKQELKLMRNSIYAKYGQIFVANGEMEKYFKSKTWYQPFQKDVSACLTEIERRNIQTILKFEQMQ